MRSRAIRPILLVLRWVTADPRAVRGVPPAAGMGDAAGTIVVRAFRGAGRKTPTDRQRLRGRGSRRIAGGPGVGGVEDSRTGNRSHHLRRTHAQPTSAPEKPARFTKERAAILAEAAKGLTGKEVTARCGISMVTYYNWRRNEGAVGKPRRRARARALPSGNGLTGEMSSIIKEGARSLAPSILGDEVMEYLAESIGKRAERRGKRK